jgi:alpha-L-fucosidase
LASDKEPGTARDIRFTRSQDSKVLYITTLGWQGGTMTIPSLSTNQFSLQGLTSTQLLNNTAGTYIDLPSPVLDGSGMHVTMPGSNPPFSALAYTVKLTFSTRIPPFGTDVSVTWMKIANVTTGLALDGGGNVASGSNLKQWSYDGSNNLQWQLVNLGSGYYRLVNRTNGMVADSWGNTANGAPARQSAWNGGNNQQWSLTSLGNNRYQIVNRGTGTALDGAGSTSSGATAVMWAPNSSTNNQWTITGA